MFAAFTGAKDDAVVAVVAFVCMLCVGLEYVQLSQWQVEELQTNLCTPLIRWRSVCSL
jgi:hypothetical protein